MYTFYLIFDSSIHVSNENNERDNDFNGHDNGRNGSRYFQLFSDSLYPIVTDSPVIDYIKYIEIHNNIYLIFLKIKFSC